MSNHPNPFSLAGKRILVTGASSGIGRQIAISSSKMGASVIVTGRHVDRLGETFGQLAGTGHQQVLADLTKQEEIHALCGSMGIIDGLVHSVGQQRLCPIKLVNEKLLSEIHSTNYLAPVLLTQRLLYKNQIADGGSIIFLSSSAAHIGTPGVGPYSAMKAALHGLVRCLALEQAKRCVRANCISPSAVETPLWDRDHLEAQKARHPLGLGQPEDVANAALYLLSDASRWVTGTTIVMDGAAT